jgi:uncharacterized membrane protein YtjA (UPF0391 family)
LVRGENCLFLCVCVLCASAQAEGGSRRRDQYFSAGAVGVAAAAAPASPILFLLFHHTLLIIVYLLTGSLSRLSVPGSNREDILIAASYVMLLYDI